MKRRSIIVIIGSALVIAGYFGFPPLFAYLQRASAKKHIQVSTAKAAAVHVATSDPKTTVMVSEENGRVHVEITQLKRNGGYIDGNVWIDPDDTHLELRLSKRIDGDYEEFSKSDANGLPTKKVVFTQDGPQVFERRAIEWVEVPQGKRGPGVPDALKFSKADAGHSPWDIPISWNEYGFPSHGSGNPYSADEIARANAFIEERITHEKIGHLLSAYLVPTQYSNRLVFIPLRADEEPSKELRARIGKDLEGFLDSIVASRPNRSADAQKP